MYEAILNVLRENGPLPADLLVSCLANAGTEVTVDQLIQLSEEDRLTCLEFERPDDGVYLTFSHPRARYRCRNFR